MGSQPSKDWLRIFSTRAGQIMAVFALVAIIMPFGWWLVRDNVRDVLRDFVVGSTPKRCVRIPATGHWIESAEPGQWATVVWHDIERVGNCGVPDLSALVVNGDGIYHDVETSTAGVMLPAGITPELRYRFRIPEGASPGRAWFRVTLDWPDEGRSINSPRIFFSIIEPEG